MLNGYKTYIVAVAAAIFAGVQFWAGNIDGNAFIAALLASAGVAGLRSGVTTEIKKIAPVFALLFAVALMAPLLAACSTSGAGNPRTLLAASETITGTAQGWWITNCVTAKAFAFCSDPATVKTVKAASQTATDAAATATDAVEATTLDAATIATLVADAQADANALSALIATLQTKK